MTDLGLYGRWASAQMIKDRNVDMSLCVHTDTHTSKHMQLPFYKSWLCQNLLVVSCRQDSQWQWWRKWAKITRAIPEAFQSKDVPACLTLQQFSPVFRSDVVMLLSFSLYPIILNGQVEERITFLISFACLRLFMFVRTCVSWSTVSVCMSLLNHITIYTHPNIDYINILKLIKAENRKVTWTFIVIIRWLVSDMSPSPTIHMLMRAFYTFCLYHDCLTLTKTHCGKMLMLTPNEGKKA